MTESYKPTDVSVAIAVMNRGNRVAMCARGFARHPMVKEVVIVDWSSAEEVRLIPDVAEMLQEFPHVRVVRVPNQQTFSLGAAFNLAIARTSCPIVAKIDCDMVMVNPVGFMRAVERLIADPQLFWHGAGGHQHGTLIVRREMFDAVGGYREDFDSWGHDDTDLYRRLRKAGGRDAVLGGHMFGHKPHSDMSRVANYNIKSKRMSERRNIRISHRPDVNPRAAYTEGDVATQLVRDVKSLLPLATWAEVFEKYSGRTVNYPDVGKGNVGDSLIWEAIMQLYAHFGLTPVRSNWEVCMWPGGGSMGSSYPLVKKRRNVLIADAERRCIPSVILPQSWSTSDHGSLRASDVWARERRSLEFAPEGARVIPDLALAWSGKVALPARVEPGEHWLMRRDVESAVGRSGSFDPARVCRSSGQYLSLASSRERVVTDRLHFAISCLLVGTPVTLVGNSYHKNRGVWEESLSQLGCQWLDGIS